jgi:hypothetical protein
MKKLLASVALGVAAMLASGANAAPLSAGLSISPDNGIENVRLVCDDAGRCYRTHGGRRVVVERDYDSYNYAPRERYIERRGYREGYYNNGPSVGIGVGPAGVGVGVGVGPRW